MTPNYRRETMEADGSRVPFEPYEGADMPPPWARREAARFEEPEPGSPHLAAARGLAKYLSLHPGMAVLTVGVDLMLHTADVMTAGLLIPLSMASGVVLGWLTYKAQRRWMGSDEESATIVAGAVALLTAIPSPLPYALFVPMGIIGFFRRKR